MKLFISILLKKFLNLITLIKTKCSSYLTWKILIFIANFDEYLTHICNFRLCAKNKFPRGSRVWRRILNYLYKKLKGVKAIMYFLLLVRRVWISHYIEWFKGVLDSRDIDFTLIVFSVQTHPRWRERIAISLNRIVRTYIFRDLIAIITIIPLNPSIKFIDSLQDPLKSFRKF